MGAKLSNANYENVALTITKRLLQHDAIVSNVVYSPLSVHVVLGLIAAGSKGSSLDQLLSFLKSKATIELNLLALEIANVVLADGSPSGGPRLTFGNGLWVDRLLSLKPSFKAVVDTYYKAKIRQPDFLHELGEVILEVNSWAEELTHGVIKNVVSPHSITEDSKLILANALYFRGTWIERFDVSKTFHDNFYLINGSSVNVPFMNNNNTSQLIAAYNGFTVLSLPYEHGTDRRRFSMNFFLPDAYDGLPYLIQILDSESEFISRHIPQVKQNLGKFKIPKFKISYGVEVSNVLKSLGLVLPFYKNSADLSEMVEDSPLAKDLYVSQISQKSVIEINELGTKAAAVTTVDIKNRTPSTKLLDFVADHPFLYAIRENTSGTLVFIGQVLNPLVHE